MQLQTIVITDFTYGTGIGGRDWDSTYRPLGILKAYQPRAGIMEIILADS